jgi:phage shock protein C
LFLNNKSNSLERSCGFVTQKRLYLSDNKVIGGVCGGVAEYFELDPTLVRLAWVLFTFVFPAGLLLYLAAMFIIPNKSDEAGLADTGTAAQNSWGSESRNRTLGLILVGLGAVLLISKLVPGISLQILLSVVFIGFGLFLMLKSD